MKTPIHRLVAAALCTASALVQAEERTMLVLDASGSMWGRLDGRAKIDIAKEALKDLVADWPQGRPVGLVAYGHRSKGDCNDIETLVQVGPLDAAGLGKTVDALVPKGMTPLSAAVRQAAEALKYTEGKATVVLLSDGKETCDQDPCALGADLERLGLDFTAHVIGFDVGKTEDQKGLRCLAETTGGRFIPAADAAELNRALRETARTPAQPPTLEPVPLPKALPKPLPKVELAAPESAVKGTLLRVEPKGEEGQKGHVYLYPKGRDRDLGFAGVRPAQAGGYQPVELRLPAQPGEYRLKWIGEDRQVYAERGLTLVEAEVWLGVPESATAGTLLPVTPHGPEGLDGHVYLYAKGRTQDLGFCGVRPAPLGGYRPCELRLPAVPGDFTLTWRSGKKEPLAEAPLALIPAEVGLALPESALAGTLLVVRIRATEGLGGHLRLVAKGKDRSIVDGGVHPDPLGGYKPVELRLPVQPGDYSLQWVSDRKEVLAESPLRLEAAQVALGLPASAVKGTQVEVLPKAPDGLTGQIRLLAKGKDRPIDLVSVREAKLGGYQPARLRLPATPGDYLVSWVSGDRQVLAEAPIAVLDAEIALLAPDQAERGTELAIGLKAPEGLDGRLCLFAPGKTAPLGCGHVREDRVSGYVPVRLKLPAETGERVLRWLSGRDEVLAEQPLAVVDAIVEGGGR